MLQTKDLQYAYAGQVAIHFPDINLDRGDHSLILGQSGSGKTTLLHLLGGLLSPSYGTVKVADTFLGQLTAGALDQFRGQHIGIVFQKPHFVRALTVEENLSLAQQLAGVTPNRDRIRLLLEQLDLGHKLRAKPDRLSVGEQQRAAIARALVNQPALILADEPTSALDDNNCARVASLLEETANAVQATLLIVTHDNRLQEKFPSHIHLKPIGHNAS